MPRSANVTPNRHLHTTLPADLAARLEAYLWSESEGKVPRSAIQTFLISRIREFFENREIDLAPYLNTPAGEAIIQGRDPAIARLIRHLETCRVNS